jgi:hypothetical protein
VPPCLLKRPLPQPLDLLSQFLRPGLKICQFVVLLLHDVRGRFVLPMVLKPPSCAKPTLVRWRFRESQHPGAYIVNWNDWHFAAIVKAGAGVMILCT